MPGGVKSGKIRLELLFGKGDVGCCGHPALGGDQGVPRAVLEAGAGAGVLRDLHHLRGQHGGHLRAGGPGVNMQQLWTPRKFFFISMRLSVARCCIGAVFPDLSLASSFCIARKNLPAYLWPGLPPSFGWLFVAWPHTGVFVSHSVCERMRVCEWVSSMSAYAQTHSLRV